MDKTFDSSLVSRGSLNYTYSGLSNGSAENIPTITLKEYLSSNFKSFKFSNNLFKYFFIYEIFLDSDKIFKSSSFETK